MYNYNFFQNKDCKFYPCHKNIKDDQFNCLFCYCPLYALGEKCGGNFKYTNKGIKDCSDCNIPHIKDNYEMITDKVKLLIDLVRKGDESE